MTRALKIPKKINFAIYFIVTIIIDFTSGVTNFGKDMKFLHFKWNIKRPFYPCYALGKMHEKVLIGL